MPARILKTKRFARDARRERITDPQLREAVSEMQSGLIDADLGGGLVKKRIGRVGQGKSGGFRTLVATNRGSRWIFLYVFAKSARANISADEGAALKTLANQLLGLTSEGVDHAVASGVLKEIDDA